jgi:hypothetical protein
MGRAAGTESAALHCGAKFSADARHILRGRCNRARQRILPLGQVSCVGEGA